MKNQRIVKFLKLCKKFLISLIKNPKVLVSLMFIAPTLIADKLYKKLFGEQLIKTVAREPRMNKNLEKEKGID